MYYSFVYDVDVQVNLYIYLLSVRDILFPRSSLLFFFFVICLLYNVFRANCA